jgi:hypothetical protein
MMKDRKSASCLLALFAFSARFLDIDRILRPNPKGALLEGRKWTLLR